MLKWPFRTGVRLSAIPETSLPATHDTPTGDRVAITEEEVFSESQLAVFEKMIEICKDAVRCVSLGADKAKEREREAYALLIQTNVIDEVMDRKAKRQAIGEFWQLIDNIRSRQGVDRDMLDIMVPTFRVLFAVMALP